MDGRVDLGRILYTLRELGDFDVICLQEVAVNFPGLPGSRGGRSQFGNAIFSRLPVGQVWRHLLPWPAEADAPSMQRVLVEAAIETDVGPLRAMTTHLEYYSQRQREIQIEAIRSLHAEACAMSARVPLAEEQGGSFEVFPRPSQAIVCGDMNFAATAPERSQFLAPFSNGVPGFRDAWETLHPREPHAPTVGIHPVDFVDQPESFDFVFINEGLTGHLKAHGIDAVTAASDHQPVWIELV